MNRISDEKLAELATRKSPADWWFGTPIHDILADLRDCRAKLASVTAERDRLRANYDEVCNWVNKLHATLFPPAPSTPAVDKISYRDEWPDHPAVKFLKRAADGKHRIVSSGDLTLLQIAEARAANLFYVEPSCVFGWALLPWELTTDKDRQREGLTASTPPPDAKPCCDEKARRIYYQDIVYSVCNQIDKILGRKIPYRIVCGTLNSPTTEVQDAMKAIAELVAQKQPDAGLTVAEQREAVRLLSQRCKAHCRVYQPDGGVVARCDCAECEFIRRPAVAAMLKEGGA